MNGINQKLICAGEYSPAFRKGTPFLTEGCIIVQCLKGNASFRLNFQEFKIQEGDLIFLFNDMVIVLEERSDDFKIRYVNITGDKVFDIYVTVTSNIMWDRLYLSPVRKETEYYYRQLNNWFEQCLFIRDNCHDDIYEKIIFRQTMSFFMVMEDLFTKHYSESSSLQRNIPWKIVGDFFILLSRKYRTQHKVCYYADALNISPDYLAVLIKNETGSSPKEIIEGKLVLAMKAMLESTTMTINEITEHLNYNDSSHLCRVFRRHVGISPGIYRKNSQMS